MKSFVFMSIALIYATLPLYSFNSIQWVDNTADMSLQSKLYIDYDNCVMKSLLHKISSSFQKCTAPTNDAYRRCSIFWGYHESEIFNDHAVNHFPTSITQTIPSLLERYPHITRITDLLIRLNQSNRVLVLIGDSITRNSIEALMCMLLLEHSPKNVTISPPLDKILYNGIHYKISFPVHPDQRSNFQLPELKGDPYWIINLVYFSLWHSFQPGRGGTTTSFHGELHRFVFNKNFPDTGALVVFNIGMHERGERMMTKNLNEMFSFAKDALVSTPNRNVSFLYRECSVQHYDEPAGMFNRNKAKRWHTGDLPFPTCRSWSVEDTDAQDWRHRAEQAAVKMTNFDTRNIVEFREYSKLFWDVHAASPFFKNLTQSLSLRRKRHAKGKEDCTHFPPAAAPLLYRLLWHQILMH